MKISETTVGQRVSIDLILGECSVRKTKTGKDYLQMTLSDGTDKIDGKIWDFDVKRGLPQSKLIYNCIGTVGEYQGKKQITVESVSLAHDQDIGRFMPQAVDSVITLWNEVQTLIGDIHNKCLRAIVSGFYLTNKDRLIRATSAKGIHHVGVGGNLQHSYEVAMTGCSIAQTLRYNVGIHYEINVSLVIAGGLMHDVGKAWCYDDSDPNYDYTRQGRELDHIALGLVIFDKWLSDNMPEMFDSEEAWALRHIISSHHGSKEKGSPTCPTNMEAIIVNEADGISATINAIKGYNDKAIAEGKTVTDRVWIIDNQPFTLQKDVLPVKEVADDNTEGNNR